MRYPEGHKQAVRDELIACTARLLRRGGLDGASIPEIMKAAGLTHGAFYVHFPSREALVAAALEKAANDTVIGEAPSWRALLQTYLSHEHVAHPEVGCAVAALGGEAPRASSKVRRAFGSVASILLARVGRAAGGRPERAMFVASALVGAVVLARAVGDPVRARQILDATRKGLEAL